MARFQAAPASVVSVSPSLVAFFKSAPWLFVAAALELRLSFALSVFIDALEMNTCNYCPPVWVCCTVSACVCRKITFILLCIWFSFLPTPLAVFFFSSITDAKILIWILHVLKTHYSILKVGQWANVRPTPMSAAFDAFLFCTSSSAHGIVW